MKHTFEDFDKMVIHSKQTLELSRFGINDDAVLVICRYLNNNPSITTLKVKENFIAVIGAKALAANTTLTTLNLWRNLIKSDGVQALSNNTTLTTLNVGVNYIGDSGAMPLAKNTTLTRLDVRHNNISAIGAKALAANATLTSLNIGYNNIGDEGVKALAFSTTLRELKVYRTGISIVGAIALISSPSLTTLHISVKRSSEPGVKTFINALKSNTKLLCISHNFSKREMETIKKILARNGLIHSYAHYTQLILAACEQSEIDKSSRSTLPLSLCTLSALSVLKSSLQLTEKQQQKFYSELSRTIPNEVYEVLANLRVLKHKLKTSLHITSLPHYGFDDCSKFSRVVKKPKI